MPPQVNATLLRVNAASSAESYDGPAAPGAEAWAGAANVYLRESRKWMSSPEGADVVADRLLLVDAGDPDVDWKVGHVVTFSRLGSAVEEVAAVKLVQRPQIDDPEIPADLITVRLTLASV